MSEKTKQLIINGYFDYPQKTNHTEAKLTLNYLSTLKDIQFFCYKYSELISEYKECSKNQISCKIEIISAIYEHNPKLIPAVNPIAFDSWSFEGIPPLESKEIDFTPNLRYTDEDNRVVIDFEDNEILQLDLILQKTKVKNE